MGSLDENQVIAIAVNTGALVLMSVYRSPFSDVLSVGSVRSSARSYVRGPRYNRLRPRFSTYFIDPDEDPVLGEHTRVLRRVRCEESRNMPKGFAFGKSLSLALQVPP